MLYNYISSRWQNKQLRIIFVVLAITLVFSCLYHFRSPIYSASLKQQYKTVIQVQYQERPIFIYRHFDSTTHTCPYYGPEHGLFHPSVEHPRFLITGGAGFIGSHLVKRLREKGYQARQIKVLDNLWRGRLHNLQYENGTWAISTYRDFCLIDLRNKDDALKFVTGADIIYHLAGVVASIDYVFSHESQVLHDNVLINTNTLYAAKINRIKNYIYVGTACSFPKHLQDGRGIRVLKEEQTYPAQLESLYGWSKLMGEYETELAKSNEFNIGILRLHNVYGPSSDYSSTTGHVIPSLIRKALNYQINDSFAVWGSGEQYRDFIYIDDVIDSLLLMFERGMNKGVIQVGTSKATTIKDVANVINELIEKKLHQKMEIIYDETQPEGDRGRIANLDRAKTILKWKPKTDIINGISRTMSWMEKDREQKRVLVIIIGQVRGGDLAWRALHKHFLQPFNAHLAFYVSNWQPTTFLHNISQYIWTVPEYDDWGVIFEMIEKTCPDSNHIKNKWRDYCKIPGMFMGGIANCTHPASAGILLALRWLVQQKIYELNLLERYDWFVLTRADELYLCNHYDFFKMNHTHALLPVGEYYGGWSDRHIIGKSSVFMKTINITTELVCKPDYWFKRLQQIGGDFNIERLQGVFWAEMNIKVSEFSRSTFTVRTQYDLTRWSKGFEHADLGKFGLKVKYPDEYKTTIQYCNISNTTNALEIIKQYNLEQ